MACIIATATEAIVATVVSKVIKNRESKQEVKVDENTSVKIPLSRKVKWLSNLLWGGTGLLAFEHVWHGEIVPYFPFLTAASNPEDTAAMLHEIQTVGVTMAVAVTVVWAGMLIGSAVLEKKAAQVEDKKEISA